MHISITHTLQIITVSYLSIYVNHYLVIYYVLLCIPIFIYFTLNKSTKFNFTTFLMIMLYLLIYSIILLYSIDYNIDQVLNLYYTMLIFSVYPIICRIYSIAKTFLNKGNNATRVIFLLTIIPMKSLTMYLIKTIVSIHFSYYILIPVSFVILIFLWIRLKVSNNLQYKDTDKIINMLFFVSFMKSLTLFVLYYLNIMDVPLYMGLEYITDFSVTICAINYFTSSYITKGLSGSGINMFPRGSTKWWLNTVLNKDSENNNVTGESSTNPINVESSPASVASSIGTPIMENITDPVNTTTENTTNPVSTVIMANSADPAHAENASNPINSVVVTNAAVAANSVATGSSTDNATTNNNASIGRRHRIPRFPRTRIWNEFYGYMDFTDWTSDGIYRIPVNSETAWRYEERIRSLERGLRRYNDIGRVREQYIMHRYGNWHNYTRHLNGERLRIYIQRYERERNSN